METNITEERKCGELEANKGSVSVTREINLPGERGGRKERVNYLRT